MSSLQKLSTINKYRLGTLCENLIYVIMLNYSTLGAEYSRVPNKQIFEGYRINLS